MATKKTTQPQAETEASASVNWKFLFKWLFILGGVCAGVMNAMVATNTIPADIQYELIATALILIGVIVGIFYFDSDDLINIGLRYVIFSAASNTISGLYKVGGFLSAFFQGFAYYLGPIVLTLVVIYFVKKYILNK